MTIQHDPRRPPAAAAIRWLEDHGDALYAYALARTGDPHIAEELVQESMLAGMTSEEGFMGLSAERTWLTGILRHKLLDHLRRALRERPLRKDWSDTHDHLFDDHGHWKVSPSYWGADPHALAEQAEFRTVLARCLSRLPARMAQAFLMREMEDVATAELCVRLNVSPENAWAILHRARMGLRRCLSLHWFDGDQPK
jgi:RNA polymerase sigma-70 factor (ECF subfamily)